ncbi:MAG: type VI secretion system baseplate subunit TssG [Deltaproteobacteria bacterium]|nr:type VI secretion system baseplate subunit TssG [Deltaproteobacteria bacterium]
MAGEVGRSSFDLRKDLFSHPRSFSFFQAIRLLRLFLRLTGEGSDTALFQNQLRVRPLLSLSFPGTDVYSVEEIPVGEATRYQLTATFLGLYGASSPLPTHYTEDLLDEASDDKSVSRDFLDILSDPFYGLFFRCWTRNRWFIKVAEEDSPDFVERLFCLAGLGLLEMQTEVPQARRLLRYIGLLTQFPRSAMGLKTLLSDALKTPHLDVIPNIPRQMQIPEQQRCYLGKQGGTLGVECYLGRQILDRIGKIQIKAGPLDADAFHEILPGCAGYEDVKLLTKVYLITPLESELKLIMDAPQVEPTVLGGHRWSLLGYDTWVFSGALTGEPAVTFQL